MKRSVIVSVGLLFLFATHFVSAAALQVVVSILPLKHFAERIGGERVSVTALVTPGQSPATYEPTPRQLTSLAGATVFFGVGVPFEAMWTPRIAAHQPGLLIVDCQPPETVVTHTRLDPHVWTSPRMARKIAQTMAATLAGIDGENAATYQANLRDYERELDTLHIDLDNVLRNGSAGKFLVFHPAWGHLAKEYGLQQFALEHNGKEPNARHLVKLIELGRREQIQLVLVQPQFSSAMARIIAQELGARIIVADPLAEQYLDNMRHVAGLIAASEAR